MAFPQILQNLFQNSGAGPLLRADILPAISIDKLPIATPAENQAGTTADKLVTPAGLNDWEDRTARAWPADMPEASLFDALKAGKLTGGTYIISNDTPAQHQAWMPSGNGLLEIVYRGYNVWALHFTSGSFYTMYCYNASSAWSATWEAPSGARGRTVITTSGTFTAPKTGYYRVTCIGGGGAGGGSGRRGGKGGGNTTFNGLVALGGGGGGGGGGGDAGAYQYGSGGGGGAGYVAEQIMYLTEGAAYALTIGAEGAASTVNGSAPAGTGAGRNSTGDSYQAGTGASGAGSGGCACVWYTGSHAMSGNGGNGGSNGTGYGGGGGGAGGCSGASGAVGLGGPGADNAASGQDGDTAYTTPKSGGHGGPGAVIIEY